MKRLMILSSILVFFLNILGCSKPEKIIRGRFVFSSTGRQGTIGAFLMRDGKITLLGNGLKGPTWSNNGKYIAATDQKDTIFICDEYGKKIQEISTPNISAWLSWSSDGKKIAYVAVDPKSRVGKGKRKIKYIYIYDLDKKTNTKIYEGDDGDRFVELSYSPKGDRLVFSSIRDDDKKGVFTINIDGTNLKKISKYGTDPSWFPDGKHLFIVNDQRDDGTYYYPTHKASYFKVDAETGEVIEEIMHEPEAIGFCTKLSRDGKYIYSSKVAYKPQGIVVIPLDGKYKHQNIPIYPKNEKPEYDLSPDWYQG